MLENPQILSLALKYAAKLDKRRMVEKLTELASKVDFNGSDIIRRTEITSSATTPKHIIRPNRKLTLSSSSKLVSRTKSLTQQSKQSQNTPNDSEQAPSTPGINASTADITLQDQRHKDDCLTPSFLNSSLTDTTVNSQESLFGDDEPKNPFLKGLKQSKPTAQNPLSLTDKFAGYDVGKKENKPANDVTDKRKQPDTPDLNPQKEKQRKLDRFMFSNRK